MCANLADAVETFLACCKRITGRSPAPILDQYIAVSDSDSVAQDCVRCYCKYFGDVVHGTVTYVSILASPKTQVMLRKRVNLSQLFRAAGTQASKLVCALLLVVVRGSPHAAVAIPPKHLAAATAYLKQNSARLSSSSSSSDDSEETQRTADKMMEILSNLRNNIAGSSNSTDTLLLPAGISLGAEYVSPSRLECGEWLEGIKAVEEVLAARLDTD